MTEIILPKCGMPVGVSGSPCMRWPGHLGACINAQGDMAYSPPKVSDPGKHSFIKMIPKEVVAVSVAVYLALVLQVVFDIYVLWRL